MRAAREPALGILAALAATTGGQAQSAPAAPQDLAPLFEHLIETRSPMDLVLKGPRNAPIQITLDATAQGNGTLQAANLLLHIYDTHLDSMLYEGGALQVRAADPDAAGHSALAIFGHVLHFKPGNDDPDKPDSAEDVLFIYTLQCPAGRFIESYRSASFDIALQTTLPGRQPCPP